MSKTIYSWNNPRPAPSKKTPKPSITAPGQNLSIRQIMDRYARGMPLTQNIKQPQYHNGEFPDIAGLDLTEIQQLKKAASERVTKLKADLQKQEKDALDLEQRKLYDQIEQLKNQLKENGNLARGKVEGEARTF